ncbi:MAG TPA: response regulator [Candidatus Paceibacterota bacterium]|nr:response regulator [Candidatus Paceibacterota bacterium]
MSNPITPIVPAEKIHILLADDDEMTLRLFSSYLVEAGYEVIHARDGNEAREMARRLHPDVLLTDNRMPVIEGLTLISTLHHEKETMDLPCILLTNDDLSLEAEKVINEIGALYVPKAEFKTHIWSALETCLHKIGKEIPGPAKEFTANLLGKQ